MLNGLVAIKLEQVFGGQNRPSKVVLKANYSVICRHYEGLTWSDPDPADPPTLNEMATIRHMGSVIKKIESAVIAKVSLKNAFKMLLTTPGIGQILGLTIMLEVGDIRRFKKAGNYSSYCRCVESKRISNGKKKGINNKKNGNRYLAWAYVEAAYHAARSNSQAQRFHQRKMSKSNRTLATKALANKLTKATYYMMRDQVPFDLGRLFQ